MKIDFSTIELQSGPMLIGSFPGCYVTDIDFSINQAITAERLRVGTLTEPDLLTALNGNPAPSLTESYTWIAKKEFPGGNLYLSATGIDPSPTGSGSVYVLFSTGV